MGGRGAWALRHNLVRLVGRDYTRRGANTITFRGTGGGGGTTEGAASAPVANGAIVGGANDAEIQAALGAGFSRDSVSTIMGGRAGVSQQISVYGNTVSVRTTDTANNFSTSFSLTKDSQGVVFVGSSAFSGTQSRSSGGAMIRGITKGLNEGVGKGLINRVDVPSAIGRAGDAHSQGSSLWARMGVSTNLSQINGLASRPASLSGAKTVADLQLSKAGRSWWNSNRQTFHGTIDFRNKSSASYKVASKFLRIR